MRAYRPRTPRRFRPSIWRRAYPVKTMDSAALPTNMPAQIVTTPTLAGANEAARAKSTWRPVTRHCIHRFVPPCSVAKQYCCCSVTIVYGTVEAAMSTSAQAVAVASTGARLQ